MKHRQANGSLRKKEVTQPQQNTEYYLFNSQGNLKAYSDDIMDFAYYGYNAANTRTYKLSLYNTNIWINGQQEPLNMQLQQAMFYPNTYLNFNGNGEYTKHYYNGTERIASRLGDNTTTIALNNNILEERKLQVEDLFKEDIQELISEPTQVDLPPVLAILNLQPTGTPNDIYYYHPNHLGSTAFVTNNNATITQGFLYAPFGEITTEYNINFGNNTIPKYSFNAKEWDEETGMYYYEARYYKPPVFTSRDPMFEKYFWMTPYAYCANNPVKYVDPTGMDWFIKGNEDACNEVVKQLNNFTSKNFSLSRNEDGSIFYDGVAKTKLDKYFKKIIDNPDITVNITAQNSNNLPENKNFGSLDNEYFGGAYGGTSIDNGHVNTNQYVNPENGKYWDKQIGKKIGYCMLHELSESYEAGKITKNKGVGDPYLNYLYYNKAHYRAGKWAMGTIFPIENTITGEWVLREVQKPSILPFGYYFSFYKLESKVEKKYGLER